ncbi:MAG TPA: hypothetical protein VHH53_02285, partial [Pseudonocardiaceae bacterium]|nr:hypothetical protein [Pseudonocardiaceae bacterium]
AGHEDDKQLPVARSTDVMWVDRKNAEESEVIKALTEAFVISLGPDAPELVAHRARWLVRVMTSLMLFPGHNEDDERSMLEEFVVPIVLPSRQATQ